MSVSRILEQHRICAEKDAHLHALLDSVDEYAALRLQRSRSSRLRVQKSFSF